MKELRIEAISENLDTVLEFVNALLETAVCPQKLKIQINIAVEEVFVNIAHYAYTPGTGFALVRAEVSGGEIRIEFEDTGRAYNPLESVRPDIAAPLEERPIGGLGIFMVKEIMDTVEYCYEGGRNLLILKRALTGAADYDH